MGTPVAPVTVEADGWTAQSWSQGAYAQTPEQMTAALTEGKTAETKPVTPPEPKVLVKTVPAGDEATETPEVTADPAPAAGDEPDEGVEAKAEKPVKRANRVDEIRKQINAATREREDIKRATQAELAELEKIRTERAALERQKAVTPEALGPKPSWPDYENDPDPKKDWNAYLRDLDAWNDKRDELRIAEAKEVGRKEAEQLLREREADLHRSMAQRQFDERLTAARAAYPDFEQVAKSGWADVPRTPFLEDIVRQHPKGVDVYYQLGKEPEKAAVLASLASEATNPMMWTVKKMADPTPLLLHLAENPDEFQRIARLPTGDQLLELGQLKARFAGAHPGSPAQPRATTSAPAPIRPVAGQRSSGAPPSLDDLPFDEYVRRQNAADMKAGRRLS